MATPEVPQELLDRLTHAEDSVQRFEFIHLAKTNSQTTGLAIVYAEQQRMKQELAGFRAETAAELETLKTEQARQGEKLDRVETSLGQVQETLAEVLRRLPEPGSAA